jgi:hypothetical protein
MIEAKLTLTSTVDSSSLMPHELSITRMMSAGVGSGGRGQVTDHIGQAEAHRVVNGSPARAKRLQLAHQIIVGRIAEDRGALRCGWQFALHGGDAVRNALCPEGMPEVPTTHR